MKAAKIFTKESDLCAAFVAEAKLRHRMEWVFYPETEGWDILAVRAADGLQLGIEAKLALNTQVVCQALPDRWSPGELGPDMRAVLVPGNAVQNGLTAICRGLGVTVIEVSENSAGWHPKGSTFFRFHPHLPDSSSRTYHDPDWHEWAPLRRHKLPDYIPDVIAGASAPVQLTQWKIRALKLEIMLERRPLTRGDFKAVQVDPTRWTSPLFKWLRLTAEGYVKGDLFPNFSAQHPVNYEQIKADFAKWDWSSSTVGALV